VEKKKKKKKKEREEREKGKEERNLGPPRPAPINALVEAPKERAPEAQRLSALIAEFEVAQIDEDDGPEGAARQARRCAGRAESRRPQSRAASDRRTSLRGGRESSSVDWRKRRRRRAEAPLAPFARERRRLLAPQACEGVRRRAEFVDQRAMSRSRNAG